MKKDSRKGLSLFLDILIASLILLLGAYLGKEFAWAIVFLAAFLLVSAVIAGIVVLIIFTIKEKVEQRKND